MCMHKQKRKTRVYSNGVESKARRAIPGKHIPDDE